MSLVDYAIAVRRRPEWRRVRLQPGPVSYTHLDVYKRQMPLSNPTSRVEATPQNILSWTDGEALVATGSPFAPVTVKGKQYPIAQCNNSYIFPGIGLGVIASGASRVTDEMLMAASETLAKHSPLVNNGEGPVLPELKDIQTVSRAIAFAVGKVAQEQGVACLLYTSRCV